MARILIDLTDIEQWSGTHGGTQRVVYGIAKYFYLQRDSLPQDVQFISFAAPEKRFYFSRFDPIYERVEGIESQPTFQVAPSAAPQPSSSKAQLRAQLKPYIPEAIRQNPLARKIAQKTLHIAATSEKKANEFLQDTPQPQPIPVTPVFDWVEFEKDDTVLMLGKPWDNLDIQKTLSEQRKEVHFKLVQVVYDLIICLQSHLHHPSLVEPYTKHMLEAIQHSDLLLPISHSSDRDLKKLAALHNLKCPDTKVIRLGDDIGGDVTAAATKPDPRIARKFIMCVGTVEIRKNHTLLYYTYKLAAERGIELPQLLIVGGQGWLSGDVQHLIATDANVRDKIILLHGVSDEGLAWMYQHCQFSIYPSMYEGWGLPVAESLAHGKLCISSNASSMPEIAGDLIDYFSPYSTDECLEKITLYQNDELRHKKEAAIKKQYKTTSWEQTFKQVVEYIS